MKKYKNLFLAEKTSELWPFSLRDINIYFNNKTRRLYSLLCLWKRLERLSLFEKFGSPEKGWLVLCGALLWRRGDLHPRLEVSAVSLDTQPGPFLDVKDRMLNHPSGDFPELSPKLVLQSRHAVRHWRVGLALQMPPEEGVTRIHVRRNVWKWKDTSVPPACAPQQMLSAMLRTHDRRHSPLVPYRPDLPCWNWTAEWWIENTGVKRKQDGGDLFVQLYTKWRQIYRVSCLSCCEIVKTFWKLNPWYLTYFKVDL